MLKNFIRLYIILAIVTTLFVLNVEPIFDFIFHNQITRIKNKVLSGPFYIVKQELYKKPISEWPVIVEKLQVNFGYPISVKKIEEFNLTKKERKHLHKEKYLETESDAEIIWYSLLKDNVHVLAFVMSESLTEENHRAAMGFFYLLSKYIREKPEADWQSQIDKLQSKIKLPIKLLKIDNIDLDEKLMVLLEQNKAIGINLETLNESYLMRIKDTDYVIKVGPLYKKGDIIIQYAGYIALSFFAGLIAIALYLWMRPIWRDLSKLDDVAAKFGQGEFQSRVNLPKRSAIWYLANTFDNMAERINRLINSHKELTNAVSHELRTPISRLRFAIEMLSEAKEEKSKQRFINSMNTDIEELEMLVSELLNYARFDRETPELELTQLDISTWLPGVINKIKAENNYVMLKFISLKSQETVIMDFDQKLIERALNNLIRNAVRYTSSTVEVYLECSKDNCSIFIDDDGPGIPAKDRKRMLEPFTRQDSSRNRKSGGYGLGLSIVQQIIKSHNGSITISTSVYGGASFRIDLPLPDIQYLNDDAK